LSVGAWSELTALTYGVRPSDSAVELGRAVPILISIKDERWAQFLHLDEVLAMLSSLPPQASEMAKAQMRAVMGVNPSDFLTKVRCPVLAIFGEKDTSILCFPHRHLLPLRAALSCVVERRRVAEERARRREEIVLCADQLAVSKPPTAGWGLVLQWELPCLCLVDRVCHSPDPEEAHLFIGGNLIKLMMITAHQLGIELLR